MEKKPQGKGTIKNSDKKKLVIDPLECSTYRGQGSQDVGSPGVFSPLLVNVPAPSLPQVW